MQIVVGFGANLGDPAEAFRRALDSLGSKHEIIALSSLFSTRPEGPKQPDYLNLAALLEVRDDPAALLAGCRQLERDAGRDRSREQRWGPRTLDLDLLIARGVVHRGPELVLPHPRFAERAFALLPASELAPSWTHPVLGRTIVELATEAERRDPDAVLTREPFT
jgi:2-amino-4-hydroxy-6-hydroxymethyldihydropteridine diphosphokinase